LNKLIVEQAELCSHCINLRSLNVRHFGMVEATGLKYGIEVAFNGTAGLLNLMKI
jgi:hypothetical protein